MKEFDQLPQRIFLDSSTLQTLQQYGGFIYEYEDLPLDDQIRRDRNGVEKLRSLRSIMEITERAPFQFALSENSFVEVRKRGNRKYLQWAYDVLHHWLICLEESGESIYDQTIIDRLSSNSFGYLGSGDRQLISDAIRLGCDTFLTMENKLPKNSDHIQRALNIKVESPNTTWNRIVPWAALFR